MIEENEIITDATLDETGMNGLRDRIMPILETTSKICEATASLVYKHEDSEISIVTTYEGSDEPVVSAINKISGMLDPGDGLSIIQNIRDHEQASSLLSDVEIEKVQFYAGASLKSETGNNIGVLCIHDSKPRELSEDQKQLLRVMIDGAKAQLLLYKQPELSKDSGKKLKTYTALLKNSADLTFLLEPEQGKITHVSEGVEKELGYSLDMLLGKPFTDILLKEELDGDTIDQWFLIAKQHKGRYTAAVRFMDHQKRKRSYMCEFSADENHWYVTARDISDRKEAELGVYELKDKLQKIVSVATDLIYQLDWESGDFYWGDELTDILGYPHTEKFVNYDWWLDKIHPDDLKRVTHNMENTVQGDKQKSKLVYQIRTFDGSYKYVMNRIYVNRNKDGMTENIIGAIVDVSDLVELEEHSKRNEKSLEEKETLLAEIHHRVKNNLAVVSGMLQLQAYNETDERVQQKLIASTERIGTMAKIHELLYKSSGFEKLRIDENIEQLISSLVSTHDESLDLNVSFDMEPVELNIDYALPCSLIVNEVITNVLKYAYDDGDSGSLEVCLYQHEETVTLKIRDDGKGLPEDFNVEGKGSSLGLVLIETLTKQLKGTYSYTSLDRGVEFKLVFDKSDNKVEESNSE
ncbi:PAS domain S-box protein [Rhodohalobacter sp. SW132]|uniref:histidine kinase dimerization/phosphoacceptor domain -containing protein n=1 Tax=Rhodohalobacter sp. SW132 TaxID=2293433 RepID=UPI000E26C406|nr:histidine kinase dimerization/phosphoacceptor domain -containing protein [Rhodohalobacter sp. SW132]REL38164.1 PAS domain S-box protein [Rhodohalobacter sp. SW132]